jgi:hypothetical protein
VLVSSSGPDAQSRAALRALMRLLPGVSVMDGVVSVESRGASDPPNLRPATVIEGTTLRALRVPDFSPEAKSGFGAFLDGTQKVQVVGHRVGLPIVIGTASAAVRVRIDRRMTTWGEELPCVERKFYLPLRYLPALAELAADAAQGSWQIVDTSSADKSGEYPSQHPTVLLERATRAVEQEREQLEDRMAEAWCARGNSPIFIDGGISRTKSVASSPLAVGVVKSHHTLYVEGDALGIVLGLGKGERTSVFRVSPRSRHSVMSWYLRLRGGEGRDPMWGLVRVEVAERERASDRANEISRWIMAETTPLSLPDGRWDKLAYGVRDCEEFLRAIS